MAKSLQQFREWAVAQGGNISNPTTDPKRKFPGQCVSLDQQYLNQVFGIPYAPRGHAKDFKPPNFTRVSGALRPGDILIYGSKFGGGFGHTELIDDDGQALGQNRKGDKRVTRGSVLPGYSAIYRPNAGFAVKTPVAGGGVATVQKAVANVRSAPKLSAPLAGSQKLKRGDTFRYSGKVQGDVVGGNGTWYQSTKGNFVHSNGVTG